jgi:predicted P-loop ATPase
MMAATIVTAKMTSAIALARGGFRVFPIYDLLSSKRCTCGNAKCPSPGKHPRIEGGLLSASADEKIVSSWWRRQRWGESNIGIVTGLYALGKCLLVIDVDPRHGGTEALAALEQRLGALPDSVRVHTGGGGLHIYLQSGVEVRNSSSRLGPGIDVRGEGGYVLAPPSTHVSGGVYAWDEGGDLLNCPVAEIPPAWLATCLEERAGAAAGARRRREAPAEGGLPIIEGDRNNHLTRVAGTLRRQGCTEQVILAALLAENSDRVALDEAEVKAIAASVARYAPGDAWKAMPTAPVPAAAAGAEAQGPASAASAAGGQEPGAWEEVLIRDKHGRPKNCLANLVAIMTHAPEWAGRVGFDESRGKIRVRQPLPGEEGSETWLIRDWTDADETDAAVQLQRVYGLNAQPTTVYAALLSVARAGAYNPLAAQLHSLEWDGVPRLDTWLSTYLRAEDTPYVRAVGAAWLRSAIERALSPGREVYAILCLESDDQGKGKTKALKIIGDAWYHEITGDFLDKDTMIQVRAAWIVEIGEGLSTARSSVEAAKSAITRTTDTYRPAYGRHQITEPRRSAWCLTTNKRDYLRDETGNRRYWPVTVGECDLDALARDRNQLLAEAVATWQAGQGVNIPRDLWPVAALEQSDRRERDPWEGAVERLLEGREEPISISEALHQIGMPVERQNKSAGNRMGAVLRGLGWWPSQIRTPRGQDGAGKRSRVWVFCPPVPDAPAVTQVTQDEGGTER